jgi:hypothetical protein
VSRRQHRQPAQTFVIAALAMTSMLGAVSLVIDAGIYFVIQHQLQNAADAAALDAVWFFPACAQSMEPSGCQASYPGATPPQCTVFGDLNPCSAAVYTTQANWSAALSLCQGPNLPAGSIPIDISTGPGQLLNVPGVQPYVVTLSCDAPHWFGRVLPGVNLTMRISVSSVAALGWMGPSGDLLGALPSPPTPLVARLIL